MLASIHNVLLYLPQQCPAGAIASSNSKVETKAHTDLDKGCASVTSKVLKLTEYTTLKASTTCRANCSCKTHLSNSSTHSLQKESALCRQPASQTVSSHVFSSKVRSHNADFSVANESCSLSLNQYSSAEKQTSSICVEATEDGSFPGKLGMVQHQDETQIEIRWQKGCSRPGKFHDYVGYGREKYKRLAAWVKQSRLCVMPDNLSTGAKATRLVQDTVDNRLTPKDLHISRRHMSMSRQCTQELIKDTQQTNVSGQHSTTVTQATSIHQIDSGRDADQGDKVHEVGERTKDAQDVQLLVGMAVPMTNLGFSGPELTLLF